jgi:hypothetical protein
MYYTPNTALTTPPNTMSHPAKLTPDYSALSLAELLAKSNEILQLLHNNPKKIVKASINALLSAHGEKISKTKQESIKFLVAFTS